MSADAIEVDLREPAERPVAEQVAHVVEEHEDAECFTDVYGAVLLVDDVEAAMTLHEAGRPVVCASAEALVEAVLDGLPEKQRKWLAVEDPYRTLVTIVVLTGTGDEERERGRAEVERLTGAGFTAGLLDWSPFAEVADDVPASVGEVVRMLARAGRVGEPSFRGRIANRGYGLRHAAQKAWEERKAKRERERRESFTPAQRIREDVLRRGKGFENHRLTERDLRRLDDEAHERLAEQIPALRAQEIIEASDAEGREARKAQERVRMSASFSIVDAIEGRAERPAAIDGLVHMGLVGSEPTTYLWTGQQGTGKSPALGFHLGLVALAARDVFGLFASHLDERDTVVLLTAEDSREEITTHPDYVRIAADVGPEVTERLRIVSPFRADPDEDVDPLPAGCFMEWTEAGCEEHGRVQREAIEARGWRPPAIVVFDSATSLAGDEERWNLNYRGPAKRLWRNVRAYVRGLGGRSAIVLHHSSTTGGEQSSAGSPDLRSQARTGWATYAAGSGRGMPKHSDARTLTLGRLYSGRYRITRDEEAVGLFVASDPAERPEEPQAGVEHVAFIVANARRWAEQKWLDSGAAEDGRAPSQRWISHVIWKQASEAGEVPGLRNTKASNLVEQAVAQGVVAWDEMVSPARSPSVVLTDKGRDLLDEEGLA